jgi:hypothetical protein
MEQQGYANKEEGQDDNGIAAALACLGEEAAGMRGSVGSWLDAASCMATQWRTGHTWELRPRQLIDRDE